MKRRTKLFTGLTAGVMALSAMCFGFAQWSSEISLGGTVNLNGKWDVAVTDASIVELSSGAQAKAVTNISEAAYDVVLYPVYADYANVNINSQRYTYRIDDVNTQKVSVLASEFNAYEASIGVFSFTSGSKSGDYTFRLAPNAAGQAIQAGKWNRPYVDATDEGAYDGALIGYAIAWCYQGSSTNTPANDKVVLTYANAKNYFAENQTTETLSTASFTASDVTYVPVDFSLPGAWAKYAVTITNSGTTNANLNDWDLSVSELGEAYTIQTPAMVENEVLTPGESCTLEFVIAVNPDLTENAAGSNQFQLALNYVQDNVEPAPTSLLHTHH